MENIPYELIARYLAGECNEHEKQQVQEWARAYPELMDEFSNIWQQHPADDFISDVEHALQQVNNRIITKKESSSKQLFLWIGTAAAVILLVLVVGIRYLNTSGNVPQDTLLTIHTDLKETLEYILPDGSKVWLNQSSDIRFPEVFEGKTREIYLEGEAFFDVMPDADKPFIIHANNTLTRVVGTSFGIRATKDVDEVIVTVSTGVINFSTEKDSKSIELHQGEQGIYEPGQQRLEKNGDMDPNLLAWRTKVLVFKQTPLSEVVTVLKDVYHMPVTVEHSIADLQLTSTFEQLSLDEIIQIMEMTLQIKSRTNKNEILLSAD